MLQYCSIWLGLFQTGIAVIRYCSGRVSAAPPLPLSSLVDQTPSDFSLRASAAAPAPDTPLTLHMQGYLCAEIYAVFLFWTKFEMKTPKQQVNKRWCVPAAGAGPTMTPRLNVLLVLLLSLAAVSVLAQRRRQSSSSSTSSSSSSGNNEWNYRDGCEHPHDSFSLLLWCQRRNSLRLLVLLPFLYDTSVSQELELPISEGFRFFFSATLWSPFTITDTKVIQSDANTLFGLWFSNNTVITQ